MKPGYTVDVPLHAEVIALEENSTGKGEFHLSLVCNGHEIGRFGLIKLQPMNDEEEVELIRRGVCECLEGAIRIVSDISDGTLSLATEGEKPGYEGLFTTDTN